MRKARTGSSLVEAIVGLALLSMLMMMLFFIYRMGASAWKKSEAQTQLTQEAQVVVARLSREVERSVYASAEVDPGPTAGTAVAFLSCWNETTSRYEYDPINRSPIWQTYNICYYNSATQQVLWTGTPLTPPSINPAPLASLATFRTGGKVMANNVTVCDFTLSERVLQLRLEMRRKRYGSEDLELVELPCQMFFRN